MKQLSPLDSAFLFLDTRNAPLHVGALQIFMAPDKKSASFSDFRERLEQRLHLIPVLRQKILTVPFDLEAPYLVDDPDFSLNSHLSHIGVPNPGTRTALNTLVADIIQRPLNKQAALWEIVFIDNMPFVEVNARHSFAIISKVHQTIVDELGGEDLLSKLLDFSPEPHNKIKAIPFKPCEQPTNFDLFLKSYGSAIRSPKRMAQIIAKASTAGANLVARKTAGSLKKITHFRRAPASLFERQLSADRVFSNITIPLYQLKRCQTLCPNANIQEVLMGIIATGLNRYLKEKDALPKDNLIALAPIAHLTSNKTATQHELQAILVTLATSECTILERIAAARASYSTPQHYPKNAKLAKLTAFLPSLNLSIAAKLYTRWHISNTHNPLFNIVITNVPGPQIPMYIGKAKLVEHYGIGPIFNGMGLSIVVISYDGTVSIALTSCKAIIPDPDILTGHINASFQKLWESSKPKAITKPQGSRRRHERSLQNYRT